MKTTRSDLNEYVNIGLSDFFDDRLIALQALELNHLISFYPYSYIIDHISNAPKLISSMIDFQIRSYDKNTFGNVLKKIAFQIIQNNYSGKT